MKKNDITLMLFPSDTGSPKKIRLPRNIVRAVLVLSTVLFLSAIGSSIYFGKKYAELKNDQVEIADLKHGVPRAK